MTSGRSLAGFAGSHPIKKINQKLSTRSRGAGQDRRCAPAVVVSSEPRQLDAAGAPPALPPTPQAAAASALESGRHLRSAFTVRHACSSSTAGVCDGLRQTLAFVEMQKRRSVRLGSPSAYTGGEFPCGAESSRVGAWVARPRTHREATPTERTVS